MQLSWILLYKPFTFRSEAERRGAEAAPRDEWQHWKGALNESTTVLNQGNQSQRPRDFLDDSDGDKEETPATTDEVDFYFSLAQEIKDIYVLDCWRNFRLLAPRVAEMARQFLATPASSARVERLLSAAGVTYSDLSGAMTEDTFDRTRLAVSNYSPALYSEGV